MLKEIYNKLIPNLEKEGLKPNRITNIDNGICFVFIRNDIIVYVEFYYDGDIGLIAENTTKKTTIENIDISMEEVIPKLKELFKL